MMEIGGRNAPRFVKGKTLQEHDATLMGASVLAVTARRIKHNEYDMELVLGSKALKTC